MKKEQLQVNDKVLAKSARSPYNSYNFLSKISNVNPKYFVSLGTKSNYALYRHVHNNKILLKCYDFDLSNITNAYYYFNIATQVHENYRKPNVVYAPHYVQINIRPYDKEHHSKMKFCNLSFYSGPEWTNLYNYDNTIAVIVFRPHFQNMNHPNTQLIHIFKSEIGEGYDPNDSLLPKDTFKTEFVTKINQEFCKNFKVVSFNGEYITYNHLNNKNITLISYIGEIINCYYSSDDILMSISMNPINFTYKNINDPKIKSQRSIYEKITFTVKPYDSLIKGNKIISMPYRSVKVINRSFAINIIDKDTFRKPDYIICSYPPLDASKNPPVQIISLSRPTDKDNIDSSNAEEDKLSSNQILDPGNIDDFYTPDYNVASVKQ